MFCRLVQVAITVRARAVSASGMTRLQQRAVSANRLPLPITSVSTSENDAEDRRPSHRGRLWRPRAP